VGGTRPSPASAKGVARATQFQSSSASRFTAGDRALQAALPVVGFLSSGSRQAFASIVKALFQGLGEIGYVEGQNFSIEYRWAEGQYDQLPIMADELVRRPVAVLITSGGTVSARAAKAATTSIPIVFSTADDPVAARLVTSLNRPGVNLTGVSFISGELGAKALELLHEVVPAANLVGVLVKPDSPNNGGPMHP
jgi:putative tryptophan/tyrosine transport system substrate-binding protein